MTRDPTAAKGALPTRVSRRMRRTWRSRTPALPRKSFDRQITWLLGGPRSGSTWLVRLLVRHPLVVELNEPQIGLNLTPFLADLDGFDAGELDVTNFTNRRLRRAMPSEFFNDDFESVWAPDLGRLIRRRLYAGLRREYPNRSLRQTELVVKEPNGTQSADLLLAATPEARLLFLVRDARDVVDSELAAVAAGAWVSELFPGMRGIDPSERVAYARKAAHRWAMRAEIVREAIERHPGPALEIRYEDLRPNAAEELQRILTWMGLETELSQVEAWVEERSFERIDSAKRGPSSIRRAARPGGWSENLSDDEISAIVDVAGETMRSFGYET